MCRLRPRRHPGLFRRRRAGRRLSRRLLSPRASCRLESIGNRSLVSLSLFIRLFSEDLMYAGFATWRLPHGLLKGTDCRRRDVEHWKWGTGCRISILFPVLSAWALL